MDLSLRNWIFINDAKKKRKNYNVLEYVFLWQKKRLVSVCWIVNKFLKKKRAQNKINKRKKKIAHTRTTTMTKKRKQMRRKKKNSVINNDEWYVIWSLLFWCHHCNEFFVINLTISINICFTNHLINFFIRQFFT